MLSSTQQIQHREHHTILVICSTKELGEKIYNELKQFEQTFSSLKIGSFCNPPIGNEEDLLQHITTGTPPIIIGTPDSISALVRNKKVILSDTINIIVFDMEIVVKNLGWLNQTTHLPINKTITMIINHFFITDHFSFICDIMENQKNKKVMMFSNKTCTDARHWFENWVENVMYTKENGSNFFNSHKLSFPQISQLKYLMMPLQN